METALVIVALIAFIGFRQWLQHHRRILVHRERMAALEKGVELPPLDVEVKRTNWNVQRILLLSGWIWISIGIGGLVAGTIMMQQVHEGGPARGIEFLGLIPVGIGVAHLITYWTGEKRERRPSP